MKGLLIVCGLAVVFFMGMCAGRMSVDDGGTVAIQETPTVEELSERVPKPEKSLPKRPSKEDLERYHSDDAQTYNEGVFHLQARVAVIQNVEPNKLRVGGGDFRVKRNPSSLGGAFVYSPKYVYRGTTRNLVWWVPLLENVYTVKAYPLNSPSKMVTPGLTFPSFAGLRKTPRTASVISYVFEGGPSPVTDEHIDNYAYGYDACGNAASIYKQAGTRDPEKAADWISEILDPPILKQQMKQGCLDALTGKPKGRVRGVAGNTEGYGRPE